MLVSLELYFYRFWRATTIHFKIIALYSMTAGAFFQTYIPKVHNLSSNKQHATVKSVSPDSFLNEMLTRNTPNTFHQHVARQKVPELLSGKPHSFNMLRNLYYRWINSLTHPHYMAVFSVLVAVIQQLPQQWLTVARWLLIMNRNETIFLLIIIISVFIVAAL